MIQIFIIYITKVYEICILDLSTQNHGEFCHNIKPHYRTCYLKETRLLRPLCTQINQVYGSKRIRFTERYSKLTMKSKLTYAVLFDKILFLLKISFRFPYSTYTSLLRLVIQFSTNVIDSHNIIMVI